MLNFGRVLVAQNSSPGNTWNNQGTTPSTPDAQPWPLKKKAHLWHLGDGLGSGDVYGWDNHLATRKKKHLATETNSQST